MDTIFYWTGAAIWGTAAGLLTLLVCFLVWRAVFASLDVLAQMIWAYRRGQPRSEYYTPVGKIWIQQFFSCKWEEFVFHVRRACGPVSPWVKGESLRRGGYSHLDND